jgi:hypothetical protein
MSESDSNSDIGKIHSELKEQNNFLKKHLKNERERKKISRAENIHVLVALGVLSSFIALLTSNRITIPTLECVQGPADFGCILLIHVALSILFIPAKLATITARPIFDPDWLTDLDEKYLPIIHVYIFIGSLLPIFLLSIGRNPSHEYLPLLYFGIEAIVLVLPAIRYGQGFQEKVQEINAATTDRRVIIAGSGSGDATELHLENPTGEVIESDQIELQIDAPLGLDVRVGQSIELESNLYQPAKDLKPEHPQNLPIFIDRSSKSGGISSDSVEIVLLIDGEKHDTKTIKTRY